MHQYKVCLSIIYSEGHQRQAQHICSPSNRSEKNHLDDNFRREIFGSERDSYQHGTPSSWLNSEYVCVCVYLALSHTQVSFQKQPQCVSYRTTQRAWETAVRRYQYISRVRQEKVKGVCSILI